MSPVLCCKRSGVRRGKRILGGCTMEKGLGRVFMLFAEGYEGIFLLQLLCELVTKINFVP